MTKYRNSLLSAAAIFALSSTSAMANYIPLSSAAADNNWVILGVSGVISGDGAVVIEGGEFSIPDTAANRIYDTGITADEIEGSGLTVGGKDLGQAKVVADAAGNLEVRVNTTGVTYLETDPVRTMYVEVSTDGTGSSAFAFSYKASLEGKRLEFAIAGGDAYYLTIDSDNTFDNPASGTKTEASGSGNTGSDLTSLLQTSVLADAKSMVDYDFTNNPPLASGWNATDYRDVAVGTDRLRVYNYNALTSQWNIFDSENTLGTNDFTDVQKGKGYWAKMDLDGGADEAGLVLGTPGISSADYTAAGLKDGWNFMSFDAKNSTIRNAATGMLITLEAAADTDFTISDSSGNHVITIADANAAGNTNVDVAKNINSTISQAKLLGTIPYTVNIVAFPTGTANQIAIISNKKFTVKDTGAKLAAGTTLAGQALIDPTDISADAANPIDATGATSVYGEFAMVIEPVIGGVDADSLDKASIQIAGTTETIVIPYTPGASTVAGAAGEIAAHQDLSGLLGLVTQMDLEIDGASGHLLLASTSPFDVRDHTFTRVFKYTDSGTTSQINITGAGADDLATHDILTGKTATEIANEAVFGIDTVGPIGASPDTTGTKVVIVSNIENQSKYFVAEDTADNLQASTSGDPIALGAISGVYNIGKLAKKAVRNDVTLTSPVATEISDHVDDGFTFSYTTVLSAAPIAGTLVKPGALTNDETSDVDNKAFYDSLVTQINTDLAALNLNGSASHNYVTGGTPADEIDGVVITITGTDVIAVTGVATEGGTVAGDIADFTAAADLGYISGVSPDLTTDLKYNYVHTPDYVMNGPLYTMRENGLTLRALVTGNTDIATGTVVWESVDLTRAPSEWFNSQDYDLFEVDAKAGYWAYLQADATATAITLASVDVSELKYQHHFDADGTTKNSFVGSINVITTGLDLFADKFNSPRVTATYGGQTFDLTQDAGNANKFDGDISFHEAIGVASGTHYDVEIRVADGFGNAIYEAFPLAIDNKKPLAPTVVSANGEFTINADPIDTDVTGFYVYGQLPTENNAADNIISIISGTAGVSGGACAGQTASIAGGAAASLTIYAVDGTGLFGFGNFSDPATEDFMPIMVDRARISDAHTGAVDATSDGVLYDANCSVVSDLPYTSGVTLTAVTTDASVQLAYTPLGANDNTELPISVYVTDGTTIAKITYPESYATKDVFVQLASDKVWGYTLPARDVEGIDSNSPYTLLLNKDNIQF